MKFIRPIAFLLAATLAVVCLPALGQAPSGATPPSFPTADEGLLPAFPGAEGYGMYTTGGRGGRVYHVTTLADGTEPGTLRHAVDQDGPRTVVFDVAGTIHLDKPLPITHGNLTLAGQSAPGMGICIASRPVTVCADNVIIRYIRFRPGNEGGGEPDGLAGSGCRNVIVDHCSISWSVDECCSLYGMENLTVQWCLISESLRMAGHSKGPHGYGAIFGGAGASYHHNLLAHHESRTPRLGPSVGTQEREWVDMRCNVVYNWAGAGCYGAEGMRVNIVNNYYKPGPATPPASNRVAHRICAIGVRTTAYVHNRHGQLNRWAPMEHVWGAYYVDGNVVEGCPDVSRDNWPLGIYAQIDNDACDQTFSDSIRQAIHLDQPLDVAPVSTQTADEAYELVLAQAGCSHWRDELDHRIVEETRAGTALYHGSVSPDAATKPGLIDLPTDVMPDGATSPWPDLCDCYSHPALRQDTDGDGMPDVWEQAHGLNPRKPADGNGTSLSPEGYTNLEVYLNSLVNER